ncbi:hypothetical protein FRC09_009604 [Ceratobasidium sp. 395]|nr:hypothetical protein FRC09_009604 [Ceratobasidium sp. 395]
MSNSHLSSGDMDHEPISNERNSSPDRDEDRHDAMEVDSGLSIEGERPQQGGRLPPPTQSFDLGSSVTAPISTPAPASTSREPPAFDEDTERPRQRRRFHVTVEDETDGEIRPGTGAGGPSVDDETAVLESAPPRMSELSITTPPVAEHGPMLDVVQELPAPAEPASPNQGNQSPHLNTIPLPDVPPPPNPNAPPDPVMEAARRLTTGPDTNPDQMQADLALLAPYIAAQAMAAAFPMGGRPPPGGGTNPGNPPTEGQGQAPNATNGGQPPLPPLPFLPFLFGQGGGELPADPKRAERLANGLKVAESGLLKRWKSVCGDEGAVCAVCYGELLEEPGIEREKEKEQDKSKVEEAGSELKEQVGEDAHEQALRDMLKRRELMEKLEKEDKERKLETAVLAFPCGHVFHRTCLLPWLSRHTTCPTCRFDIDPKSDTLNLPPDEPMNLNGFNFQDFFTIGPVIRVPRAQAPGGPFPRPPRNRDDARDRSEQNEEPRSNGEGGRATPRGASGNNDPASVLDMFETLFGPLLHSVGVPAPPRQPPARRPAQSAGNNFEAPSTVPAPATSQPAPVPNAAPAPVTVPPVAPTPATSTPAPSSETPSAASPTRRRPPVPQRPAEPRRNVEDRDRPVAMFGRLTPRRPPQPITPSWMRPSRPAPAPAPASASTSAPAPTAAAPETASDPVPPTTSAASSSTAGPSVPAESTPTASTSTAGQSQSSESHRHGFGQLRAMVSNLIPRRISTSGITSSTASVRSTRSAGSTASASTTRNAPQGPLSPRTGLRAMLHGPASLLRDLTTGRRSGPGNRSRASTSSATMPSLESESEDEETFSEDGAESDYDEDMPALEPIEGRQRPSTTTPGQTDPELEGNAPEQADQSSNEPPSAARPEMLDSIITLRIDLGHADGRDETIIVPLLFNPNPRPGAGPRTGDAQPAAQAPAPPPRPRTPPPQKKWTPPEAVKTFRQVVEEKEREAGWRCDDPACLLGPADDEEPSDEPHIITPRYPIMRSIVPGGPMRQKVEDGIRVYADGEDFRVNGENPVCEHTLHAECLVTSARVNGWGPTQNAAPNSRVTLRCPVCRLEGTVERQVWDAGMEAEAAELD